MKFGHLKATCSILLPDGAPEWVHLLTLGVIRGRDGREWKVTDPQAVVAASAARGLDAVIDYEHQTDLAEKNGQPAPAAGWIKEFQVRADGIWGRVDWTAQGAERIRAKEYRYLSPTFVHRKSGEVVAILRAALTNAPDLFLTALATEQDDDSMEELLKALRAALGLPETATQETALAKVGDLVKSAATAASAETALAAARQALGLADDADAKAIETAIATAKAAKVDPDPKAFVPRAEFERVSTQLAGLEKSLTADKATAAAEKAAAAVEKAMCDRKIAPASKDWAIGYATKDPDGFAAYCKAAPAVIAPGGGLERKPKAGDPLSEEEKAMCRQLGLDEAAFLKSRDEEVAR